MDMDSVTLTGVTSVENLSHLFNLPLHVLQLIFPFLHLGVKTVKQVSSVSTPHTTPRLRPTVQFQCSHSSAYVCLCSETYAAIPERSLE